MAEPADKPSTNLDNISRIGKLGNRQDQLKELRTVIDAAKVMPKESLQRLAVLTETHKLLHNMSPGVEDAQFTQMANEVKDVLRKDHSYTPERLTAEARSAVHTTLNAGIKTVGAANFTDAPAQMWNTLRKEDMVTQSLIVGGVAAGLSTVYGVVRNWFRKAEEKTGIWSWTKRTALSVAAAVGALWGWDVLKSERGLNIGGDSHSGKPVNPDAGKGQAAEPAPMPRSAAEKPVEVPPHPKDVLFIEQTETGNKKHPCWEIPIGVHILESFRGDATRDKQSWFYNAITNKSYTRTELIARLKEIKTEYQTTYPQEDVSRNVQLSMIHGTTGTVIPFGKPADPKTIAKEVGIASVEGSMHFLEQQSLPEKNSRYAQVNISSAPPSVTFKSVRYLTDDDYMLGLLKAGQPNNFYHSAEDFKATNKRVSELRLTGPCNLEFTMGMKTALPLKEVLARLDSPEKSLCRLSWHVTVLGPSTTPPLDTANPDAFLLAGGDSTPCTIEQFKEKIAGVKKDCGIVPTQFHFYIHRSKGKSVPGEKYQSMINELYKEDHSLVVLQDGHIGV